MEASERKANIRDRMRKARRKLSDEEHTLLSERICQRISDRVDLPGADHVLLYYPAPGEREVDLRPLFEMAFEALSGTQCLLPRVDTREGRIRSHVIPDDHFDCREELKAYYSLSHEASPLEEGNFGIPEPDPDRCPLVEPGQLDLVFVPGLAFDSEGFRVGYGGGYYDRLLADLSPDALSVGVGYEFQRIDRCPREPHDRNVSGVVTETSMY